jgi:polynucleotide 5'-hydroxyl-kinase GRC3/NOL9
MVKGPATVTVDGTCHVLGSDVSGRIIKIRYGKALPFEPDGHCRLRIRLKKGGMVWRASPKEAGVSMWHDIARQVSTSDKKKVIVMLAGDVDTGKSTLSAYLANVIIEKGLKPCIIDGDIGQGDLAPPTCIGAGIITEQVTDLRDARASTFEFVGSTSPAGFELSVVKKLKSILERTRPTADVIIVNTDGYVRDGGIQYKLAIAKQLQPDLLVCLGNPVLLSAFKAGPWQVLRARAAAPISKTRYERTSRRLEQFLRHIGSGSFDADLHRVKFVYMDRIFSAMEMARLQIMQLEPENMKRMFVGLGMDDTVKGFGIIIDVTRDRIRIQTNIDRFDTIYLSNIRLGSGRHAEVRTA